MTFDPDFRLGTARLSLRPATPADRADLVALESDPEVMRYLNGGQAVPEAGLPEGDFLTPRGGEPEVLVAHLAATGAFVGWFALFDDGMVDGQRQGEVGYRLARAHWGQGLASEALAALIGHGFAVLGLSVIRAETMTVNLASRRVMEKAGMTHLRTLHPVFAEPIPGAEAGEVIYEIRRAPG